MSELIVQSEATKISLENMMPSDLFRGSVREIATRVIREGDIFALTLTMETTGSSKSTSMRKRYELSEALLAE